VWDSSRFCAVRDHAEFSVILSPEHVMGWNLLALDPDLLAGLKTALLVDPNRPVGRFETGG
jgi:hypothetical protein